MNRRVFVTSLGVSLATPRGAWAQPTKGAKIGWLMAASPEAGARALETFRDELRRLGYEEGRHHVIETRFVNGRPEKLTPAARQLAALPVDVIVTPSTPRRSRPCREHETFRSSW